MFKTFEHSLKFRIMIGIDTIRIKLDKFTVKRSSALIMNSEYNLSGEDKTDTLFRLEDGEEISARKAFLNSPKYNFEILKGINGTNAFVHFSIPKVHNEKSNYEMIGKDDSYKVISKIESELRSSGIITDLYNGKVSRLDICRNVITDKKYNEYDNVLNNLQMKRAVKKDLGKNVDTHLWKNTLQEICLYDKHKEMTFKKNDVSGVHENTVRCEIRLMRTRKVNDEFQFDNVESMFDRYNELGTNYRKKLKTNIFKYDISEFEVLLKNEVVSRLNYFRSHYKRNAVNEFIKSFGIVMIERLIGMKVFELALKESGCKRNTIHYVRKNYNKKIFENSLFGSNNNPAELYNELKFKLCEAA